MEGLEDARWQAGTGRMSSEHFEVDQHRRVFLARSPPSKRIWRVSAVLHLAPNTALLQFSSASSAASSCFALEVGDAAMAGADASLTAGCRGGHEL